MASKDELKEIDIKNCTSYYFDDIIKIDGKSNFNRWKIIQKYFSL